MKGEFLSVELVKAIQTGLRGYSCVNGQLIANVEVLIASHEAFRAEAAAANRLSDANERAAERACLRANALEAEIARLRLALANAESFIEDCPSGLVPVDRDQVLNEVRAALKQEEPPR